MTGDERDARLAADVRSALGEGPASTPEARRRVMDAVRSAAAAPDAVQGGRGWRSPAFGLLAAASIAGIIALVHARGISYTPAPVPGIDAPAPAQPMPRSAAATSIARPVGDEGTVGGVRVQFVLVSSTARHVSVVGDFNDWNPQATPLELVGGVWSSEAIVSPGRHDYAFVIDGGKWIADPSAPRAPADELGGGYSVLIAGATP